MSTALNIHKLKQPSEKLTRLKNRELFLHYLMQPITHRQTVDVQDLDTEVTSEQQEPFMTGLRIKKQITSGLQSQERSQSNLISQETSRYLKRMSQPDNSLHMASFSRHTQNKTPQPYQRQNHGYMLPKLNAQLLNIPSQSTSKQNDESLILNQQRYSAYGGSLLNLSINKHDSVPLNTKQRQQLDYAQFRQIQKTLNKNRQRVLRKTLRESVQALVDNKSKARAKQQSIDEYLRSQNQQRQMEESRSILKEGEEVLKIFKSRDSRKNIKKLKAEISKFNENAKKGQFSFSRALQEVREDQEDNTGLSAKELRVKMLNQFVVKYQDKFCIQDPQPSNSKQDAYIDYDQFFLSSKEKYLNDIFKQSYNNLRKQSISPERTNREQAINKNLDQEQEKKVDQLYEQLMQKAKTNQNSQKQSLTSSLNNTHSKISLYTVDKRKSKQQIFNEQSLRNSSKKDRSSLEQIRTNCVQVYAKYNPLTKKVDKTYDDYSHQLEVLNEQIKLKNSKNTDKPH